MQRSGCWASGLTGQVKKPLCSLLGSTQLQQQNLPSTAGWNRVSNFGTSIRLWPAEPSCRRSASWLGQKQSSNVKAARAPAAIWVASPRRATITCACCSRTVRAVCCERPSRPKARARKFAASAAGRSMSRAAATTTRPPALWPTSLRASALPR